MGNYREISGGGEITELRIVTDRGTIALNRAGNAVIHWNDEHRQEENFGKIQKFIDSTVVRHMEPYTPLRTGVLKKSVVLGSRIGSGELIYPAPYAKKRYYTEKQDNPDKLPRGSMWFHRMLAARKDTIVREIRAYTRRLMK